MSPLIQTLRVDCDAIRKGGYQIDVIPTPPTPEPRGRYFAKGEGLPNVAAAARAYEQSDKAWGRLSEIAVEYKTTPGSILGRIRRAKNL